MKKLSIEKEQKILKLYLEQKLSTTKVAKLVGISPTSVSNIIKKNGYDTRGISESKSGVKRGSKLPVDKIIHLYKQGNSSTKLAEIIGCSKRSILNILNNNNVQLREPGWNKNYKNPLESEIINLYTLGGSILEVSKKLNVSYQNTNRILKKYNVIRKENKCMGMLGKKVSEQTKNRIRKTKKIRKEEGLYDHIYLKKTGLTYKEFQKQLPEFKKYFQKVRIITNQQPLESLENFEKRGKAGQKGAFNLDHKYSIIEGFKNNVDPKIIGHIANLEMIPWRENVSKQGECSISLNQLKKNIKSYK